MRKIQVAGGTLFSLTDLEPTPAAWSYSFPEAQPQDHASVVGAWLPDGKFCTRFTVFAFKRNGRVIVVDAGLGAEPNSYFAGLSGGLRSEWERTGLDISAVEHVLFTHFHLDHVGWATDADGTAFFPNARYHAPAPELAHWMAHGSHAALTHHVAAFEGHIAPLIAQKRLGSAEAGAIVASLDGVAISYRHVPGHTAGHCAVVIEGSQETALIAGDTWHSPAQISVPEWCHRADADKARARVSRQALAEWAREQKAIVAAGHFPEAAAFGRIVQDADGRLTFSPVHDSTA